MPVLCSIWNYISYTGSLDRSTRASEHVQINLHVRLPGYQFFIIV